MRSIVWFVPCSWQTRGWWPWRRQWPKLMQAVDEVLICYFPYDDLKLFVNHSMRLLHMGAADCALWLHVTCALLTVTLNVSNAPFLHLCNDVKWWLKDLMGVLRVIFVRGRIWTIGSVLAARLLCSTARTMTTCYKQQSCLGTICPNKALKSLNRAIFFAWRLFYPLQAYELPIWRIVTYATQTKRSVHVHCGSLFTLSSWQSRHGILAATAPHPIRPPSHTCPLLDRPTTVLSSSLSSSCSTVVVTEGQRPPPVPCFCPTPASLLQQPSQSL
jgi:hypothetical protein